MRNINKLKELRLAAEMTQADVAEKVDVSQAAVSRWEDGNMPTAKYRRKLAQLFHVGEEDLKGWLENA